MVCNSIFPKEVRIAMNWKANWQRNKMNTKQKKYRVLRISQHGDDMAKDIVSIAKIGEYTLYGRTTALPSHDDNCESVRGLWKPFLLSLWGCKKRKKRRKKSSVKGADSILCRREHSSISSLPSIFTVRKKVSSKYFILQHYTIN